MQYRSILVLKMKIGSNLRIYLTETRKEADRICFEIKRQTMIITQNMFKGTVVIVNRADTLNRFS